MISHVDVSRHDHNLLERLAGKTFLITGGEGMLGRAFRSQLARHVPTGHVHSLGKVQLDVRQHTAFASLDNIRPDFVIHCAALVDADYCEDHEDEGHASIVTGTQHVADFAKNCGAKLLYPQSFLIYDGTDAQIDETCVARPLGVYGRLKLEAERLALQISNRSVSIRMAGFFGGESADDNFVGRITPHLAKLVRQGVTSIDIGDRVWQPTYTNDLAANCILLLADDADGIYCMASHGSASFYDLTVEIAKQMGVAEKIRINCIDAGVLAAKEKASRPRSAIMRNSRLIEQGLDRQRSWQHSLAEYLSQPYFKEIFNERTSASVAG